MNDTPSSRTTLRAVEPKPAAKKAPQPVEQTQIPLDSRLKTASEAMHVAYAGWLKNKGLKERESLQETMHELRRALAALEISMAMSDRD